MLRRFLLRFYKISLVFVNFFCLVQFISTKFFKKKSAPLVVRLCSTNVSTELDLCFDCARFMFRLYSTYVSTVLDLWFDCARPVVTVPDVCFDLSRPML